MRQIKALAQRADVDASAIVSVTVVSESRRSGADNPGSKQA
jgi:hypothetical protein